MNEKKEAQARKRQLKSDWKDFLAITIAILETCLIPIMLLFVCLIVLLLIVILLVPH